MKKVVLVLLGLILAWTLGAGSGLAEEKVVTVLETGGFTGPTSPLVVPVHQGSKDYFEALNAKGGIDGVKIKFISSDDRYTAARAMSFYQRYRKTPKLATLLSYGTPQAYILDPIMTRDKIPQITTGGGKFQAKPGYTFLMVCPYQNMVGSGIDWAIADWKKKGKSGMPTFAYMGWGGASGLEATNGSNKYAEQKGVKWLKPVLTTPGTLKYDTWLTGLAQQGVDYIYVHMVDPDQTFVVRDAYGLGLTKKIQFISSYYGLHDTVGLRLVKPEVVEGTVVASNIILGDERLKNPNAELWAKYQKKPPEDMDDSYLWGVGNAKIVEQALRIALKDVGYEKFNGQAFYAALQKVKGDLTQGIMGAQDLGPTNRQLTRQIRYYQVRNGKNVPISDWIETPDCLSLAEFK
ncbi:MAG: ABC transporter substrate-binding protein [Proteobacteria bacterium]|nr:ABC transporter substrate-binding protein [Pseudomonadota bacterium]